MHSRVPCITIQPKEIYIGDLIRQLTQEQFGFYFTRANSRLEVVLQAAVNSYFIPGLTAF